MFIGCADDARVWLRSWGGRPRPGILAEALRGLRMNAGIMGHCSRYSDDQRQDNLEAIAVLEAVGATL